MALNINLVDGADHEVQYANGRRSETATRVGIVSGFGSTTADAALIYARGIVEAAYPLGTPYGTGSIAVVTGYRAEGIGDDNAARVRVLYSTPFGSGDAGGGEAIPWIIERDADEEIVGTQLSPSTGKPLEVLWTNPANAAQKITDIVTVPMSRNNRRLVLSGLMTDAQADAYEVEQGKVNLSTWRGLPRGYWKFRRLYTTTVPGSGFHRARAEIITKRTESWAEYGLLRGPDGKYVRVDPADIATLRADYAFGAVYVNGAVRVGGNEGTDFSALFAI